MSSGTGDSRHYTGPAAARDAQIMTITAPATPSNGDVNGLPASAPRAPSRHSGRRQCWDNALSESFFASIKGELLDHQAWPTRDMARRAIVEYIAWYNGTRLHSTLGYRSPAEFEEDNKIKKVA